MTTFPLIRDLLDGRASGKNLRGVSDSIFDALFGDRPESPKLTFNPSDDRPTAFDDDPISMELRSGREQAMASGIDYKRHGKSRLLRLAARMRQARSNDVLLESAQPSRAAASALRLRRSRMHAILEDPAADSEAKREALEFKSWELAETTGIRERLLEYEGSLFTDNFDFTSKAMELFDQGLSPEQVQGQLLIAGMGKRTVTPGDLERIDDEHQLLLMEGNLSAAHRLLLAKRSLMQTGTTEVDPSYTAYDKYLDSVAQNWGEDSSAWDWFQIGTVNSFQATMRGIMRLAESDAVAPADKTVLERLVRNVPGLEDAPPEEEWTDPAFWKRRVGNAKWWSVVGGEFLGGFADPVFAGISGGMAKLPLVALGRASGSFGARASARYADDLIRAGVGREAAEAAAKRLTLDEFTTNAIAKWAMKRGLSEQGARSFGQMVWNITDGAVSNAMAAGIESRSYGSDVGQVLADMGKGGLAGAGMGLVFDRALNLGGRTITAGAKHLAPDARPAIAAAAEYAAHSPNRARAARIRDEVQRFGRASVERAEALGVDQLDRRQVNRLARELGLDVDDWAKLQVEAGPLEAQPTVSQVREREGAPVTADEVANELRNGVDEGLVGGTTDRDAVVDALARAQALDLAAKRAQPGKVAGKDTEHPEVGEVTYHDQPDGEVLAIRRDEQGLEVSRERYPTIQEAVSIERAMSNQLVQAERSAPAFRRELDGDPPDPRLEDRRRAVELAQEVAEGTPVRRADQPTTRLDVLNARLADSYTRAKALQEQLVNGPEELIDQVAIALEDMRPRVDAIQQEIMERHGPDVLAESVRAAGGEDVARAAQEAEAAAEAVETAERVRTATEASDELVRKTRGDEGVAELQAAREAAIEAGATPELAAQMLTPLDDAEIIARRGQLTDPREGTVTITDETPVPELDPELAEILYGNAGQPAGLTRGQFREDIANVLYGDGAPVKERQAYLIIGPTAAGKSTIADPMVERFGALLVDSDEAKALLPEFEGGRVANQVHEESSDIIDYRLMKMAVESGSNIVLPMIGKRAEKLRILRQQLADQGYTVHLVLNDLDAAEATRRAINRFHETGRFIDPHYIYNLVADKPREVFNAVKTEFDSHEWRVNDTPFGEPPRLVEASDGAPFIEAFGEFGEQLRAGSDPGGQPQPRDQGRQATEVTPEGGAPVTSPTEPAPSPAIETPVVETPDSGPELQAYLERAQADGVEVVQPPFVEASAGIPRDEMPQIATADLPEFFAELERNGVRVTETTAINGDLRPTQDQIGVEGTLKRIGNMKPMNERKPLMVSRDNHVIDGHHGWASQQIVDPTAAVPIVRIDLPALELLEVARNSPLAEARAAGVESPRAPGQMTPAQTADRPGQGIPAVRVRGRVHTGSDHAEAWKDAYRAVGRDPEADEPAFLRWVDNQPSDEGYVHGGQFSERNTPAELRAGNAAQLSRQATGRADELVLPDGSKRPMRYAVVSAAELTPSHDARAGFKKNQAGDLNERPYEDPIAGKASRGTVKSIAEGFNPRLMHSDTPTAIDGPPVAGPDGVVLGGNARAMAMQLAYARGKGDVIREAVNADAGKFGIDQAELAGIDDPVIVRILDDAGEPGEMSRQLNEALTTARTAETDAVARGRLVSDRTADLAAELIGDGTLGAVLNTPGRAMRLVQALVEDGALSQGDVTRFVDAGGRLNAQGRKALEETLLGAAIADVSVLTGATPAVRQKLTAALPAIVRLRRGGSEYDVSSSLTLAAEAHADYKASGSTSLEHYLEQATMSPRPWDDNAEALALMWSLEADGPRQFAGKIRQLADAAQDKIDGQTQLGFLGDVSAEDVFWDLFDHPRLARLKGNPLADAAPQLAGVTLYANPVGQILNGVLRLANRTEAALNTLGRRAINGPSWLGRQFVSALADTTPGRAVGAIRDVIGREFVPHYKVPIEAVALINQAKGQSALGRHIAADYARILSKGGKAKLLGVHVDEALATPENRKLMGQVLRGDPDALGIPMGIDSLPDALQPIAVRIRNTLTNLGEQAVNAGLLRRETFERNRETYLPRLYLPKELDDLGLSGVTARLRIQGDRFKLKRDAFMVMDHRGRPAADETGNIKFESPEARDRFLEDLVDAKTAEATGLSLAEIRNPTQTAALPAADRLAVESVRAKIAHGYQKIDPFTAEQLRDMGQITDPSYPVAKGMLQLNHDIAMAELFNSINTRMEWVADQPTPGFTQLPQSARLGKLSGKHVLDPIARQIDELTRMPALIAEIYDTVLRHWKKGKTVFNPATHGRNVMGNMLFADLADISPASPDNMRYYWQAAQVLAGKGDGITLPSGRKLTPRDALEELIATRTVGGSFAEAELSNVLSELKLEAATPTTTPLQWILTNIRKADGAITNVYRLEDELFKIASYFKERQRGLSSRQAAEHARQWFPFYDHIPRSGTVQTIRRTIKPFASFYLESLRIGAHAARQQPFTVLKWALAPMLLSKYSAYQLGLSDEEVDSVMEDTHGGKFLSAVLPFPDAQGRLQVWDLANVIPYADLLGKRVETGAPPFQKFAQSLLLGNPFTNLLTAYATNSNPFWGSRLWHTGMSPMEQTAEVMRFTGKTLLPPLTPGVGSAWRTLDTDKMPKGTLQMRGPGQAKLRALAGVDVRSGMPNLYRLIDDYMTEAQLPESPEWSGDTTPRSRARGRLYQAVLDRDAEAFGDTMTDLDELGIPVASPKAIRKAVKARHPLRRVTKSHRQAFLDQLLPLERESVQRTLDEYDRVLERALAMFETYEKQGGPG